MTRKLNFKKKKIRVEYVTIYRGDARCMLQFTAVMHAVPKGFVCSVVVLSMLLRATTVQLNSNDDVPDKACSVCLHFQQLF